LYNSFDFFFFFKNESHYGSLVREFRFNLYINSEQNDRLETLQAYIRDMFASYLGGGSAVLNEVLHGFLGSSMQTWQ
jgi:hypothetical protein